MTDNTITTNDHSHAPRGSALVDPETRKQLKGRLAETTHYLRQIDDLRAGLKDSIASIANDFSLDKKVTRRMVNTMYRTNYDSLIEENRHFEQMYEIIVEGKLRDE